MARRAPTFSQADIERAIGAALKAGLMIAAVEVDHSAGIFRILMGQPDTQAGKDVERRMIEAFGH